MSDHVRILAARAGIADDLGVKRGTPNERPSGYETNEEPNEANIVLRPDDSTRSAMPDHSTPKNGLPACLLLAQAVATGRADLNTALDRRQIGRIDVRVTPQLMTILSTVLSKKLMQERPKTTALIASDSAT